MKKIFTLALTLFILNAAFSQAVISARIQTSNYPPYYGYQYHQPSYNNYDRNPEVERINSYYNRQIADVLNSFMNPGRKMRIIRGLERQKRNELRSLKYNNYAPQNDYYNNGYGYKTNR